MQQASASYWRPEEGLVQELHLECSLVTCKGCQCLTAGCLLVTASHRDRTTTAAVLVCLAPATQQMQSQATVCRPNGAEHAQVSFCNS